MSKKKTLPQMFDELKEAAEDRRTKALNGGIEIGMHIRDEHEKVAKEMVDELLEDPERFCCKPCFTHTFSTLRMTAKQG